MKNPTQNTMAKEIVAKIIPLLQARLSDGLDFAFQCKQAHWNVKGTAFIALHELFDKVADAAHDWTDELAERVVQLGGIAEGTIAAVSKQSTLPAYPLDIVSGEKHCKALSRSLADFGTKVRMDIDKSSAAGDADTADLLTGVSRDIDKYLWFVEAHLQN